MRAGRPAEFCGDFPDQLMDSRFGSNSMMEFVWKIPPKIRLAQCVCVFSYHFLSLFFYRKLKSNGKGLNEAYAEALASIERPPSFSAGHSSGGSSLPQRGPTGLNPAGSNDITVDIDISDSLVNAGGEEEDERTSR